MKQASTPTRVAILTIVEVNTMTFSEIFMESMKAMVRGDRAEMERLARIEDQMIAELKKNKKEQEQLKEKNGKNFSKNT